jgi:CubicO group peptidase (beta-lactamase class C family)
MRRADRIRAGSVVKPFVAVTVLRLAESGRPSLDSRSGAVLPAYVVG